MSNRTALVVGGGIAGLATAIALSRIGFKCRVLERSAAFSEVGAGIQIGPNGTRILRQLDVLDNLAPSTGYPSHVVVRDGQSNAELSRLPLGGWIEKRHGGPYLTAHRADLHGALARAARCRPGITVDFGFDVAAIHPEENAVSVVSIDGRRFEADLLIGADGYASTVRRLVFGSFALETAGRSAARTVIPVRDTITASFSDHVGIWLAPRAHVVHYPVRSGQEIAVVAVTTDKAASEGWGTATNREDVLGGLSNLAPPLLDLLNRGEDWRRWSLVTAPPLVCWWKSGVVLVGDATGPVMPFLAQGAVMALEDSVALASALHRHENHAAAFASYEGHRRPRRKRVSEAAIRNGQIYHFEGAAALARNLVLRAAPAALVMRSYDWLYGYRTPETVHPG